MEDILPGDLVDQLCALHLESEEKWEDILLRGHNQGGGRRQTARERWTSGLPSDIKWRLLRILGDLFPVLDDLVDREPWLVERMDAPPWRGYQWSHRDFMLTLRGAPGTRVVFVSLQDDPPEKSLQIAPGTSHGYHASNTWHVVQQKRGSVLLMDVTLIHRGAGGPGRTIFFPFVPEKFRTRANVVQPENVRDLMFAEPEEPEEEEAEEDPPATSSGSDLQPPAPPAPRLSWSALLKTPPGMEKKFPYMGDLWVIGTGVGTAAISVCPFTTEGLGPEDKKPEECSMPWYHRWWIPSPMADNMVRVPVAPGCVYFGFCPSSLVLTRAPSAREMQWASMAMRYTASMPSMQAEADGKVKWNRKKKQYMCPCNEKVCSYPVFACVQCIVCSSVIRTTRTQNGSFTHAK